MLKLIDKLIILNSWLIIFSSNSGEINGDIAKEYG